MKALSEEYSSSIFILWSSASVRGDGVEKGLLGKSELVRGSWDDMLKPRDVELVPAAVVMTVGMAVVVTVVASVVIAVIGAGVSLAAAAEAMVLDGLEELEASLVAIDE